MHTHLSVRYKMWSRVFKKIFKKCCGLCPLWTFIIIIIIIYFFFNPPVFSWEVTCSSAVSARTVIRRRSWYFIIIILIFLIRVRRWSTGHYKMILQISKLWIIYFKFSYSCRTVAYLSYFFNLEICYDAGQLKPSVPVLLDYSAFDIYGRSMHKVHYSVILRLNFIETGIIRCSPLVKHIKWFRSVFYLMSLYNQEYLLGFNILYLIYER